MILKIMVIQFWVTLKISEIIDSNLSDQTKYSLNEINKIKDYFKSEIQEKKKQWVKNQASTLLHLLILTKLLLIYLQQAHEYLIFLLQVLLVLVCNEQVQE